MLILYQRACHTEPIGENIDITSQQVPWRGSPFSTSIQLYTRSINLDPGKQGVNIQRNSSFSLSTLHKADLDPLSRSNHNLCLHDRLVPKIDNLVEFL